MYVVTVLFTLKPEHASAFLQAVIHNANTSLANETGCRQFDVCVPFSPPNEVFLYELYDSREAFDAHLATPHFHIFNAQSEAWVVSKVARTMDRVCPVN